MTASTMIALPRQRVKVWALDKLSFICDLIDIEGPLLSLYRDNKSSWFRLWCDTDGSAWERWLIFEVSRPAFAGYLDQKISLREVLAQSRNIMCLEAPVAASQPEGEERAKSRFLAKVGLADIEPYMPAPESFFDPEHAPDISLAEQILPTRYEVPIGGDWYISDLDKFSRAYSGLYAFFYCTKPRFVTNVRDRLSRALRAPWEGGFSRINLFSGLVRAIPSLHDMKIREIEYASPGKVAFEALGSVGDDIRLCLDSYMSNRLEIDAAVRAINTALSAGRFKKVNLSSVSNGALNLSDEMLYLFVNNVDTIGDALGVAAQVETLVEASPNSVVAAKAVLALLTQISRLDEYEGAGMLNLTGRGAHVPAYAAKDEWLEAAVKAAAQS